MIGVRWLLKTTTDYPGIQKGSRRITKDEIQARWVEDTNFATYDARASLTVDVTKPNRVEIMGDLSGITTGNPVVGWRWNTDGLAIDGLTSAHGENGFTIKNNSARVTSTSGNTNISTIVIWIDPDYMPAQTGQPPKIASITTNTNIMPNVVTTNSYSRPTSDVTIRITVISTDTDIDKVRGDLNLFYPLVSPSGIDSGNTGAIFSHTTSGNYISVADSKTVPMANQRGGYLLTYRFMPIVRGTQTRTVYVKVRE